MCSPAYFTWTFSASSLVSQTRWYVCARNASANSYTKEHDKNQHTIVTKHVCFKQRNSIVCPIENKWLSACETVARWQGIYRIRHMNFFGVIGVRLANRMVRLRAECFGNSYATKYDNSQQIIVLVHVCYTIVCPIAKLIRRYLRVSSCNIHVRWKTTSPYASDSTAQKSHVPPNIWTTEALW